MGKNPNRMRLTLLVETAIMNPVATFLKNLLKKVLGQKASICLNRTYFAIRTFNIWNVIDMVHLRYHLARQGISRPESRFSHQLEPGEQPSRSVISVKPHLLILSEKWCEHNPTFGPSNDDHNIFGSLAASEVATYVRLNHDEYCQNHRSFDRGLLLECFRHRPDAIVIVNWLLSPLRLETLKLLKEGLQIPAVVIWGDSVNHMEEAEALLPYVDLSIMIDSTTAYLQKTHQPEKYLPMWTPEDPRIFYNPNMPRDITVSFLGTMAEHSDRLAGIAELRSAGIEVYQAGGQRENRLPVEEYARVYMRSKIAVDFCCHTNLAPQLKGRVFEATLCGAMLLESENPEIAAWFEPMVDYVPFRDEKDLVEKARYYLSHDSERIKIASRGYHKAKEKYTGKLFWETVLRRVLGTELG
ncbi:glycosyltransferase [Chloroflexota bacterium]